VILASLRRRAGRALALLLGVLVATTGFTVLTGSTDTARLQVTGTVGEHYRGAYDILVRPAGARTELEEQRQLVRPNFLSGGYGGIALDQWRTIEQIPGVEVAAPIAMLGYGHTDTSVTLNITDAVDRSATRQLIEVRPVWLADRGLTEAATDYVGYVYVTRRPVAWPVTGLVTVPMTGDLEYTDGVSRPAETSCQPGWFNYGQPYELQEDGAAELICPPRLLPGTGESEYLDVPWQVAQLTPDGEFVQDGEPSDRLTVSLGVPTPQLVAAIDPVAEAALVGLDDAVVEGRYLIPDEPALPWRPPEGIPDAPGDPMPPALVAREPLVDEQVTLVTQQVELGDERIAGRQSREILELIDPLPRRPVTGPAAPVSVGEAHHPQLWDGEHAGTGLGISTQLYRQVDPVGYDLTPAGELRPQTHPPAHRDWVTGSDLLQTAPWLSRDTGFRRLAAYPPAEVVGDLHDPVVVGVFDRDRLASVDALVSVPLETTRPATCWEASRCCRTPTRPAISPPRRACCSR
jgi:putative ABC transport system permease protein